MFNPNIKIGQELENEEISDIFKVSPRGGMRRSHTTNTLVLISFAYLYRDRWEGDTLHFTGMGLIGDQDLYSKQNRTLKESNENGIELHLFVSNHKQEYIYYGVVKLVGEPYLEIQKDENFRDRNVWMFPLKQVNIENVPKIVNAKGEKPTETSKNRETLEQAKALIGKKIKHNKFGTGTIMRLVVIEDTGNIDTVKVIFDKPLDGIIERTIGYQFFPPKGPIEWL